MRMIPRAALQTNRRFQRLRWKLTLSYTAVTLAAIVALELLVFGAAWLSVALNADTTATQMTQQLVDEVAPQLLPLVEGTAPDLASIEAWLHAISQRGLVTRQGAVVLNGVAEQLADLDAYVIVLDAHQRVLGVLDHGHATRAPRSMDVAAIPGLAATYARVLAGEHDITHLWWRNQSRLTIAAPIVGPTGSVSGALVYSLSFGPRSIPVLDLGRMLLVGAGVCALVAGAIGTVFGYFTARGLTGRLDQIAATVTAWAAHEFGQTIADTSPDEIGQLSLQLNGMAKEVQTALLLEQHLGRVEERQRLARDLHDSVKQHVFAIRMNLATIETLWERDANAARRRIGITSDLARQCQRELTAIIQTLRPSQLEGMPLVPALHAYLARWQEQSGIHTALTNQQLRDFPLQIEDTLFRVVQEALTNVARHSQATAVVVALVQQHGSVHLTISDNGRGFNSEAPRVGMGLRSITERVGVVRGSMQVHSGRAGTTLRATIPLAEGGTAQ